ncbi:uncharacterized protein LOC126683261 [Mercurialis annua]|uniref:uncharacterized protein LOC126683261 n=1 Tax=Mercurialis annua TaxID=3986 RepID=UPI00215DEB48|nr:uncharacterized protein LOC126683261 [Mercurialis annua]
MFIVYPATIAGGATTAYSFAKSNLKNPPSVSVAIFNIHRSVLPPRSRLSRVHAGLSPQPPNTQPDPPPPKENDREGAGIVATLSRLQDRIQIFSAVLLWMSLFFWASAWDGRNGDSGRPNKGSRFRR